MTSGKSKISLNICLNGEYMEQQGCGLGLDALVSRPFRGAVVPRLGLASFSIKKASCTSLEQIESFVYLWDRCSLTMAAVHGTFKTDWQCGV